MTFIELFEECFKDNLSPITNQLNYQNSYKITDYTNVELFWSTKDCYYIKTEYYFENFEIEKLNHKFIFNVNTIKPFISNEKLDLTYKLNKINNNDIYINVLKKVDNELDSLNDIIDIFSEKEIKSIISKFKKTIKSEDKFLHKIPTKWILSTFEEFYKNKLIENIDNESIFKELKDNKESYLQELNKICLIEENKVIEFNKVPEEFNDIKQKENYLFCSDNYKVLRALEDQKIYIDVIYIDPPYNTGKKFIYNDNMKENFQWLTFMKQRLDIAKNILNENGIIFISIDNNEIHRLRKLCDEIFYEKNFIEEFIWIKNAASNNSKTTITKHEYILCYAKNKKEILNKNFFNIKKNGFNETMAFIENCKKDSISIKDSEILLRAFLKENKNNFSKSIQYYKFLDDKYNVFSIADLGNPSANAINNLDYTYELYNNGIKIEMPKRGWLYKREDMLDKINNNLIYFSSNKPRLKKYLKNLEYHNLSSIIHNCDDGFKELQIIFNNKNEFQYTKQTSLIKNLL